MDNWTFLDLFRWRVESTPAAPALLHSASGSWQTVSWADFDRLTDQIACGLLSLGLGPGDRVGLLSRSRLEWVLSDIGILKAGCCTVPIHVNLPADGVCHVLTDSGAVAAFVESEELAAKVRCVSGGLEVRRFVVMRGPARGPQEMPWDELLAAGRVQAAEFPGALAVRQKVLESSSLATLVYTSGTTGLPKGAMLTHDNLVYESESLAEVMLGYLDASDLHLLCLPLSHILARVMVLAAVPVGYATAFSVGIETLDRDFLEVRPTFVTVVPAILEELHAAVHQGIRGRNVLVRRLFGWAREVGERSARTRSRREPLPLSLAVGDAVARRLVKDGIAERFGGRLKFFISGGAPLSLEIAEYLESLGVLVLEGYGLTENTGAAAVNRPDRYLLGTVGPPIPGLEVRIEADSEILLHGRNVMSGYFNQPQASAEAVDEAGWLHTGDLGRLEDGGFLRVTGRKKDILVTSSGKNVSPQLIESLLRTSPFIQQAMVVGDGRRFLAALIVPDPEQLQRFAEEAGLAFDRLQELTCHPKVLALIQTEIDERNAQLAPHEALRRFTILPEPLSLADGEITATFKLRRQEIEARYRDLIEAMYEEGVEHSSAVCLEGS